MHIEIRKEKDKKKYYLAYSYRKEGKTRKIRVYLGEDLSGKQIAGKRKEAEGKIQERLQSVSFIHDPYRTVLAPSEIQELRGLEAKGRIKMVHLGENDWLKFTEAFTYDTNAIEGSTIGGKEVGNILERDKWPDKPKEEISETYGVAEAVAYIRKTKEHVSLELIRELHRIVFKNSKHFTGRFRGRGWRSSSPMGLAMLSTGERLQPRSFLSLKDWWAGIKKTGRNTRH